MEIHKPKPVHSWRDFFSEYAVIVVGILTALALEQVVQSLEWAHKAHVASAAIAAEMGSDNGPQVYERLMIHDCLTGRLDAIRAGIEGGMSRPDLWRLIDGYQLDFSTYGAVALQAANTSGVTLHLSEEAAKRWSRLYDTIPLMDRTSEREAGDIARLRALARTGGALTASERDGLLAATEALRGDETLMQMAANWTWRQVREQEIKLNPKGMANFRGWALSHYPGCARDLPGGWQ